MLIARLYRKQYRFDHANLCLNPFVLSISIRRVCFRLKGTIGAQIKVYTITAGQTCTCDTILLRNICDFSFSQGFVRMATQTIIHR